MPVWVMKVLCLRVVCVCARVVYVLCVVHCALCVVCVCVVCRMLCVCLLATRVDIILDPCALTLLNNACIKFAKLSCASCVLCVMLSCHVHNLRLGLSANAFGGAACMCDGALRTVAPYNTCCFRAASEKPAASEQPQTPAPESSESSSCSSPSARLFHVIGMTPRSLLPG